MNNFIVAKWPAPSWVRAYTTTRRGGISQAPYESFNLGICSERCKDNPQHVAINRLHLQQRLNLAVEPLWLNQIHGNTVLQLNDALLETRPSEPAADGVWTTKVGVPCLVLTADCLPLLLCNTKGTVVSALHCGWRGIASGIIERAVAILKAQTSDPLLAWMGPTISQENYETGEEVRQQFLQLNPLHENAFKPGVRPGKWLGNLYQLATNCLRESGVNAVYGGEYCTYRDAQDFYSFRRQGKQSGSIGTLIYISGV